MKLPIIDNFLNSITMYRLTLYYLIVLVGIAAILSVFHILSYNPMDIAIQATAAVITCYVGNIILAKIFGAVTNSESALITAFILTLIIPVQFPRGVPFIILASGLAMAAKYLPTIEKRHIFNPAAAGIAATALLSPEHNATWWVGTPVLMPYVLIGGLLLARRIRRERLVVVFLAIYLLINAGFSVFHTGVITSIPTIWWQSIASSALLFFTFVMLTEPLTSPPTEKLQSYYAGLVAFLYATPQLNLFSFALTPELALLVGNVYAYIVSPKYRLVLQLKEKMQVAKDTILFNFGRVNSFAFAPGQYMEWTLPHNHVDSRGNRRYFSLASSPSEDLQITVRFYEPSSSYKKALGGMQHGDTIIATSLEGSFVLPQDVSKPLVFVAGGVGIAPFRSMIKYIIDNKLRVNIIVLYANRLKEEIAFADILAQAEVFGVRTIYTLTDTQHVPADWFGARGYFTPEMIAHYIPDFAQRTFYISGPQLLVERLEGTLRSMGVAGGHMKTDYFPGYKEK